jgi:hypothetical protein
LAQLPSQPAHHSRPAPLSHHRSRPVLSSQPSLQTSLTATAGLRGGCGPVAHRVDPTPPRAVRSLPKHCALPLRRCPPGPLVIPSTPPSLCKSRAKPLSQGRFSRFPAHQPSMLERLSIDSRMHATQVGQRAPSSHRRRDMRDVAVTPTAA